jgi:hypothetical protein
MIEINPNINSRLEKNPLLVKGITRFLDELIALNPNPESKSLRKLNNYLEKFSPPEAIELFSNKNSFSFFTYKQLLQIL